MPDPITSIAGLQRSLQIRRWSLGSRTLSLYVVSLRDINEEYPDELGKDKMGKPTFTSTKFLTWAGIMEKLLSSLLSIFNKHTALSLLP